MKIKDPVKVRVSERVFMFYYRKYNKLVFSILSSYTQLSRSDREDIAVMIFSAIPDLAMRFDQRKAKLSTYIAAATKNYANSYLKNKLVEELPLYIDPSELVDETTLVSKSEFKISVLEKYLEPDEYKLIFMLYCMNITLVNYCKMVGCTRAVARYKHKLVLEKVKKIIDYYQG